MNPIFVDEEIQLIPYYPNYKTSLRWYQDLDVCKQVDNLDHPYDPERLSRMYRYLKRNGDLFYIKYHGRLCGDVCLQNNGTLAIVVCKEYQNRHIGRRAIAAMIDLARKRGYPQVSAEIYDFNTQSQRMFESVGFCRGKDGLFVFPLA